MFQLILVVVTLVAVTYFWRSNGASKKRAFTGMDNLFNGMDNLFKGRYKTPPPKDLNLTIDKGTMTRCHNCSCFFPEHQVIHDVVEGHILEFCSENCRRNFHSPVRK